MFLIKWCFFSFDSRHNTSYLKCIELNRIPYFVLHSPKGIFYQNSIVYQNSISVTPKQGLEELTKLRSNYVVNRSEIRYAHTGNNIRCYTTQPTDMGTKPSKNDARNAIHWAGHTSTTNHFKNVHSYQQSP